jgi:hypothetical protein
MTAEVYGEFVVFLIGMLVNRFWKVHKWLPVAPRMIRELASDPTSRIPDVQAWFGSPSIIVQYWRSFEHLERYAKAPDKTHWPAWVAFNKAIGTSGDVGVWHGTYRVRSGHYECVYNNMPLFGLAKATRRVDATGRKETAAGRMSGG